MTLAAAAYATAIAWLSWPLCTAPGSALVDPAQLHVDASAWTRADLDLLVWILGWVAHALVTQPTALFQANMFYPAPDALASSEHLIGLAPVAAPVFWLTGNAVLAYNLTLFAVVWTAALATFMLVREWTESAAAAFLAGTAFALAPLVTGSWIRLHVSAIHLFPLVLLLAWRVARAPRARNVVALTIVTAVQLLSGAYTNFELAALLTAFAPTLWLTARRNAHATIAIVAAFGIAALIALPSALPYLRVRAAGQLPSLENSLAMVALTAPTPLGVVASVGAQVTWPVLGLALLALIWPGRVAAPIKLGLAAVALLGGILAVGPNLSVVPGTSLSSLYELAMRVVPGFAAMRTSVRFLILPVLASAVLAGIACGQILDSARSATAHATVARLVTIAVVAFGGALVFVRQPQPPLALARNVLSGSEAAAARYLREQPSAGAVLELPVTNSVLDGGTLAWTGRAMLRSTLHWRPLLNGYSGHPPSSLQPLMTLAQRLPDPRAIAALCELTGLEWIVARFGTMRGEEARWATPEVLEVLEPPVLFGTDTVFRLRRRCPPPDRATFARFTDPAAERTIAGTILQRLDAAQSRAAIDADIPASMAPGRYAWTWLDVTNSGTATWPGLSAASPWVVLLRSRWRDAATGKVAVEGEAIPLVADVAPGEHVRAQVNLLAPRQPGTYVLEIGLVQRGAAWLSDAPGAEPALQRTVQVAAPSVAAPSIAAPDAAARPAA